METIGTNQHYVSQMLLRGFATDPNGEQVWAFDKKTGKKFTTAIRVVASEPGYYDLNDTATLDTAMNRADGTTSQIIILFANAGHLQALRRQTGKFSLGL